MTMTINAAAELGGAAPAAVNNRSPAPAARPCPPWCDIDDHDDWDEGKMHHTLTWCVPASAYPYECMGERHFDDILVSRKQVGDGEPVFLIEAPGTLAAAEDPDGLITVPRQFIVTPAEAVELAVTLLNLAASQEMRLADADRDSGKSGPAVPTGAALEAAGALVNVAALKARGLVYAPGDQSPCCPGDHLDAFPYPAVICPDCGSLYPMRSTTPKTNGATG